MKQHRQHSKHKWQTPDNKTQTSERNQKLSTFKGTKGAQNTATPPLEHQSTRCRWALISKSRDQSLTGLFATLQTFNLHGRLETACSEGLVFGPASSLYVTLRVLQTWEVIRSETRGFVEREKEKKDSDPFSVQTVHPISCRIDPYNVALSCSVQLHTAGSWPSRSLIFINEYKLSRIYRFFRALYPTGPSCPKQRLLVRRQTRSNLQSALLQSQFWSLRQSHDLVCVGGIV